MQRITVKDLKNLISRINDKAGNNGNPYQRNSEGRLRAVPGVYHLSGAYGGYKLVQMCNEGGGEQDPINMGFETKRIAYGMISAFLYGLEAA